MGTPNVQLHHNKLFVKPPSIGSPFPAHQDAPFFPHDNDSMIAAVIFLSDCPVERGPFRAFPGSHRQHLSHDPKGGWHLSDSDFPPDGGVELPAEAGDLLLFSYLLVHRSGQNVSNEPRTTLLIQARDPEDRPTELVHLSRGQGTMLRGIDPTAGRNMAENGHGSEVGTMGTMGAMGAMKSMPH